MSTIYLRIEDLLEVEKRLGAPGIRDVGLLESALARPQATVFGDDAYPTFVLKASALVHSLVTNRALIDGNKRLGYVALRLFLEMNDYRLVADEEDRFGFIMAIADGSLSDVEAIAGRLGPLMRPLG